MGTPDFAVPSLRALAETGNYNIVSVITQPDRPAGRGREMRPSDVKQAALELDLPVWTPETLKHDDAVERLHDLAPDVGVVAAYGEILRPNVLHIPSKGFINVHASLLPKYRGAAPIPAAILNGDDSAGVTIMLMDEGMDTGPILAQRSIPVRSDETGGSLFARLSELGAELLVETLPRWLQDHITPRPQNEDEATVTRMLKKEDGRIDWSEPAARLERQIRAYTPWPGSFTTWNGSRLKVIAAGVNDKPTDDVAPGTVQVLDGGVAVATGAGWLTLDKLQLAGKNVVTADAFMNGYQDFVGSQLGQTK